MGREENCDAISSNHKEDLKDEVVGLRVICDFPEHELMVRDKQEEI